MKRIIQLLLVLLPIGALAQQSNSSMEVECGDASTYELTAIPEAGSHFVKWADDVNAPNPREVQVTDNIIYTAVFALDGTPDTIVNGQKENVSELYSTTTGTIDTIVIQPGGELTIDEDRTITTLIIESDGTQSGQVHNTTNLNASEMYLDYRLNPVGDEASPDQWYAVAVPFTVNIQDGVTRKEGSSSVYGTDFLFLTYNSEMRAQTGKGWKQMAETDVLEPGKFYLMGIDGTCNHWLFKKKDETSLPSSTVNVTYFGNGDSNAGINGIANPTLEYMKSSLNENVYVCFYDNVHGVFEAPIRLGDLTEETFAVGKPFFIQVDGNTNIDFDLPSSSSLAPRRASMSVNPLMRMLLTNTQNEESGRMYISLHNDNQTGHYVIGRDFARMDNKNTRPHLWYEAFGLQLAAHGIQAPSATTEVPFVMSTPFAGHFRLTMSTRAMDDYMVELLYNGEYIANLSDEEPYAFELNKGISNGYSIRLRAKSPTDIKPVQGEEATSAKILLDNQLYIRHGEHVYDAQGRKIK